MARSIIDLKGESDVTLKEITSWLSKLAGELESDVPLVVEAETTSNGDEVSLTIRIGPCGGKVGPFFAFVPPEGDPLPDQRLAEVVLKSAKFE